MRGAVLVLSLALAACASVSPPTDEATPFAQLQALEQRLAAAAFRLTTANAALCDSRAPQTGMTIHDALQYGPGARAGAVRYFRLTDAPAVMAVAPDSPADRAGLKAGDAITTVNGRSLRSPVPIDAPVGYEGVARAWSLIGAELARGPATLSVTRAGQALELTLEPVDGCDWQTQLVPSGTINAFSDGRVVSLTTALTRYAARDDELAAVVGHEMAHNLLRHAAHPVGSRRDRERQADRVGLYLTARAGYDISGASAFWRRFGEDSWQARLGMLTHPGSDSRSHALAVVGSEIEAKRAAGQPLVPSY